MSTNIVNKGRVFEKLSLMVAIGLAVSGIIFAALIALLWESGDVQYNVVDDEAGEVAVKVVPVAEDSTLIIPAEVGSVLHKYKVVKVENHAFENNTSFAHLSIPEGVTSIGYSAFYGCKALEKLTLPNSVKQISDGAFFSCSRLAEVQITPGVTDLGEYVFERCTGLRRVVVCEGVKTLSRSLFCKCTSLAELVLPQSLVTIEPLAFKDCESLTEVVLPDGLLDLGGCSFEMCTSLSRVVIPSHVRGLGVTAFNGCKNLVSVTSLATVPPPLGSAVFDDINPLAVLHVPTESLDAYRHSPWADYFSAIVPIVEEEGHNSFACLDVTPFDFGFADFEPEPDDE